MVNSDKKLKKSMIPFDPESGYECLRQRTSVLKRLSGMPNATWF